MIQNVATTYSIYYNMDLIITYYNFHVMWLFRTQPSKSNPEFSRQVLAGGAFSKGASRAESVISQRGVGPTGNSEKYQERGVDGGLWHRVCYILLQNVIIRNHFAENQMDPNIPHKLDCFRT